MLRPPATSTRVRSSAASDVYKRQVLVRVARANNMGQAPLIDPTSWVLIGTAAGVVGGLLVGLGIGMPRRTANAVRHETIEELHRQTTADAAVAAAAVTEPADEPRTEPTA